ncbi:EamA family transporter [Moraxella catarrhalis]|uniref:EamA family transporter RarD n=1 Tax=Moraxella catarrhalis TaxID=480 RepID=UPI0001D26205|nr:EamA family transporter RarD [Moraxella catarrhalis]ADG61154.1 RarD protein [Moraxella catarrhalis BBH18]AXT94869.1 chloramphenical resistance permease RarD [Moraxella catarrhalis]MPW71425.1 EamA family transporter [Moraxella catarrhalis]MPW75779.1 EamA family transporter [Moraxella catarrhalis]
MAKTVTTTPKGLLTVLSAFLIWGCFPLYFKELIEYDAIEIIVHRVVWTFVVLLGITIITRRFRWIDQIKKQPKWLFLTFLASILIATNWLVYVWAVTHDQVLEASLGYFIHPLVGVLFSMLIFKEKLRLMQKLTVLLAAAAVGIQIVWMGGLPWVSMLLPLSWGLYGVIQRQTPFDTLDGLFLETALLVPISLIWLQFSHVASSSMAFWVSSEIWLLMLAGPVTLVPLLLYNISTKLVQFNTLSFLNYLTPSLIFLLAIFYYHEPFDAKRLLVFVLIWVGLLMFSADMFKHKKGA